MGALQWKSIRKYRAGAATKRAAHADVHNVAGLVLEAYENACEMLAFVRDGDGEQLREREIRRALAEIQAYGFAEAFRYELAIVGGVPVPKLEGWLLCLLGARGTDEMTSARVDRELAATEISPKSLADYVSVAETGALPGGPGSLSEWLAQAASAFRRLLDGEPPP